MIPYEELCAALDRFNGVQANQAEMDRLEAIEEDSPVEQAAEQAAAVESYDEQLAYEAEPIEEIGSAEIQSADELVVSSAGEDEAAAAGELGTHDENQGTPLPPVDEQAVVVEPVVQYGEGRHDATDEVSLDEVEVVSTTEEDPNN